MKASGSNRMVDFKYHNNIIRVRSAALRYGW